jgi:hypothetical protein
MIRIPEVMQFSNNVDLFKAFADYFNHYRAENYGKKVTFDTSKTFEEKTAEFNKALTAEINKIAGFASDTIISENVLKMSPDYRYKAFAVVNALVDMIIPDVVADAYGRFSEIRNVAYGDSPVFDIKSSDLFYVTKNGNNRRHVTAQKQFSSQTQLLPVNRSITVQVDLYRVLCGKENLAEYAMKVALSIEAEIAKDIYAALSGTYSTLTANFKEADYTQLAFTKLANRVSAANGGAKPFVYGTNVALQDILPTNEYLKMGLGETYNSVGYLPVFMNTSLISLPQKIDWDSADYEFAIADDELFFISSGVQSLVKVVLEGETISIADATFANANLSQNITLHKRWVVGVVSNAKHGVMKIV